MGGTCVARDTSCGLLHLCEKIARIARYRVLEGHLWQPRLFVDDKSRARAVLAELLVRAEL